jgi:hypothetical protein
LYLSSSALIVIDMSRLCVVFLVELICSATLRAGAAPATQPGAIRYESVVRENPPQRGFVAYVDLTDPRVSITCAPGGPDPDGDGPWKTTLQRTSVIAQANNFDLAVNAVFFNHYSRAGTPRLYDVGDSAESANVLIIDGKFVSARREGVAFTIFKDGICTIGTVNQRALPGIRTAIGGSNQILFRGQITAPADAPAPRTSVGLSKDAKTMIVLVIDGRRPDYSVGLSMADLAAEMLRLGAHNAINLDGGGSSTFVRKTFVRKNAVDKSDKTTFNVINSPSDGSQLPIRLSFERPVAYVLGVNIKD